MPAIAQALSVLPNHDTAWAQSLRKALDEKGIKLEQAVEQPIYYAQVIMDNPLSNFTQTYVDVEDTP